MDKLFDYLANTKVSELKIEVVKDLIKKGADLNWHNKYGETVLHIAAIRNLSVEIIELLVEKGSDVNSRDYYGYTPLMKAVIHRNNLITINYLLENGADINLQTITGHSALMIALRLRIFEPLKIFKYYYVDLDIISNEDENCRDLAYEVFNETSKSEIHNLLNALGFDFSPAHEMIHYDEIAQPLLLFGNETTNRYVSSTSYAF